MTDLTGPFAGSQTPAGAGTQTAISEINAAGGVNGRKIVVVGSFDSQSTSQGGAAAAQQAISAGPDVIVVQGAGLAIGGGMPAFQQANIPTFGANVTVSFLEPPQPFFYGLGTSGSKGAAAYLNEAARVVGSDQLKLAVIGLNDPSVDASIKQIESAVPAYGATIVATERTAGGLTSFTTQAAKIVQAGANVVVTVDAPNNAVTEAKALITAGFQGRILAPYTASDDASMSTVNSPNFEAYRFGRVLTDQDSVYQSGIKADQPADLLLGGIFSLGYAQGYLIKAAFADCTSTCGADQVQKALEAGPITVPNNILFGPLSFTSKSHSGMTAARYYHWDVDKKTVVPVGADPVSLKLKGQ